MRERLFRGDVFEYERSRREDFDPIAEGKRYGLAPVVSVALWKHVHRAATSNDGRCDENAARARFAQLAELIARRGGQFGPEPFHWTQIDLALGRLPPDNLLAERVPGRTTLVLAEASAHVRVGLSAVPGRTTLVVNHVATDAGSFDESRGFFRRYVNAGHAACAKLEDAIAVRDHYAAVIATSAVKQDLASARRHLANGLERDEGLRAELAALEGPAEQLLAKLPNMSAGGQPWERWGPSSAEWRAVIDGDAERADSLPQAGTRPNGQRAPQRLPGSLRGALAGSAPGMLTRVETELDGMAASASSGDALGPLMPDRVMRMAADAGEPLDVTTRATMERRMGAHFGDVRIHTGEVAGRTAQRLGAAAFAHGIDVVFAPGRYRPDSPSGQRLLAHELAHVIQQRGGSGGPTVAAGVPGGAAEREADAAATAVIAGQPVPRLSAAPRAIQLNGPDEVGGESVGHVDQHPFGGSVHRVGDSAASSILMDIERMPGGAVVYRWFSFEVGATRVGGPGDWDLLVGAAIFASAPEFAKLGHALTASEWRHLWPNPVVELMRRYEAGTLAISDPAILTAYRGMVRANASRQLDDNERQIDELLASSDRIARIQDYANGLREASVVRDHLVTRQAEIRHSLTQAHSFTFGIAGNLQNMDQYQRMRQTTELQGVNEAIAGWLAAFPLLTRMRTAAISPAGIEAALRSIKANIAATRPRIGIGGGLDPMDLQNTRAHVDQTMGPRASGVVAAADRSRSAWQIAGAVASTVGMVALLFVPGGVFIDAAIGVAIAAESIADAFVIGQAANTGLHVDDGLMTQAQANSARWHAILSVVFAAVGAAAAGLRVLRVASAFMNVRRALPELELAQQAQLARVLSRDSSLLRTLIGPEARDDAFILSRVRSAARELAHDPAALRRSLEVTGQLARIPRRVVETDVYTPLRAITDGSDVQAIARITGKTPEQVAAARQHFLFDEHILVDDAGALYRGRFVADENDARIWLRAAEGRPLPRGDVDHLSRLIQHEFVEGGVMASQGRTIEQAFMRGELEGMLRRFLGQHMRPAQVEQILTHETRPIMPFRYAHYVAHFTGGPNP